MNKLFKYTMVFICCVLAQHILISLAITMSLHIEAMKSMGMIYWDLTGGAFISYAIAYEEYLKDKDETSNG